jgi:RES domain-containing protein
VEIFRLARRPFVQGSGGAFGGEGAYIAGSRWNTPRRRMAFAALSESLAILEYLAHATSEAYFDDVLVIVAQIDDRYVTAIDPAKLPKNWRSFPPGIETQLLGNAWLESAGSVALRVPSALVPHEQNVLINPAHKDFKRLSVLSTHAWDSSDRFRV